MRVLNLATCYKAHVHVGQHIASANGRTIHRWQYLAASVMNTLSVTGEGVTMDESKRHPWTEQTEDLARFENHLRWASNVVASWPEWKRNIWRGGPNRSRSPQQNSIQ